MHNMKCLCANTIVLTISQGAFISLQICQAHEHTFFTSLKKKTFTLKMLTSTALAECARDIITLMQRKCELFLSSFIQNPVPSEHMLPRFNAGGKREDIAYS